MTAAQCEIAIAEYTPLQVKQAVTGFGNADKKQVQTMVQKILGLDKMPKPDDAADALAIAICHLHSYRLANMFKGRRFS
jgi:crossover junction endodeoxyribonuclease RuvC